MGITPTLKTQFKLVRLQCEIIGLCARSQEISTNQTKVHGDLTIKIRNKCTVH